MTIKMKKRLLKIIAKIELGRVFFPTQAVFDFLG